MVFSFLAEFITKVILAIGYPGIIFLMALESMITPIPSELVMPFVGFLVAEGTFSFFWAVIASAVGCMLGGWVGYAMGYYGGNPFVLKIGKWFLLDKKHLFWTEKWFTQNGAKTIFFSRFIPIVRHIISIPAGIGKMDLLTFSTYTFAGSLIWNTFLLWLGVKLGQHWELVHEYSQPLDYLVIAGIAVGLSYYLYKIYKTFFKKTTM